MEGDMRRAGTADAGLGELRAAATRASVLARDFARMAASFCLSDPPEEGEAILGRLGLTSLSEMLLIRDGAESPKVFGS